MRSNPAFGKAVTAATALALFTLAFAATSSNASGRDDFRDDWCHEECREAIQFCERASTAVHKACRSGCEEAVTTARREAAAICESEELDEDACMRLTRGLVKDAKEGCRLDCAKAHKRGRHACKEERLECRAACRPPVDGACLGECHDEFGACRDELGPCRTECREVRSKAIESCRELVSDVCDAEAFRECVHQARIEARECQETCYEDFPCASNLRACVGECVDDTDDGEKEPVEEIAD